MSLKRLSHIVFAARRLEEFDLETQLLASAFTSTEMEFRTFFHRIVEYAYALLLICLGRDASKISVGVSQISIRHYMAQEGVGQLSSLILSLSLRNNLKACCTLISSESDKSIENLCRVYNGSGTTHYRRLVLARLQEAKAMVQAREIRQQQSRTR